MIHSVSSTSTTLAFTDLDPLNLNLSFTHLHLSAEHTLPQLPYSYDALEPAISKEIMEIHHSKHHQAYGQ